MSPDISMCNDNQCTLRDRCYRYTATPNRDWQSYSDFGQDRDGNCDYFIESRDNLNKQVNNIEK